MNAVLSERQLATFGHEAGDVSLIRAREKEQKGG